MTLQSSGPISLDQIRTEYGISGAVSMNQLYRNGSYVDNTKEVTDAISSVSDSGFPWMGYSNDRYNYGNLNTKSILPPLRCLISGVRVRWLMPPPAAIAMYCTPSTL